MFERFFALVVVAGFGLFMFGAFNIFLEVEPNHCRMTYMFQTPQFSRVRFKENWEYPNYGLYYYNEGRFPKNVSTLSFNGAPVLFIPGNAGSYKQARSLASVALRKGIHNKHGIHLDYFTIDYDEELSGLYGGYLERQAAFLQHCIKAVLSLYKNAHTTKRQIVLIGHSMGGKVAQAVLAEDDVFELINTIIYISSPLDSPVVNFDSELNAFYTRTNAFLAANRQSFKPDKHTNVCDGLTYSQSNRQQQSDISPLLENVLLISIGGGNRDLLVRAALTNSQFSDIHAMTSAIPKVWVSCDHLSAVWCLQLVLVVNRFLFRISERADNNYVYFHKNKTLRLDLAAHYFVKPRMRVIEHEVDIINKYGNDNVWHQDTRRIYVKSKKSGLRKNYVEMIPLANFRSFKKLYIEVVNLSDDDSLYGCTAKAAPTGIIFCTTGTLLSHTFQEVLSKDATRSVATLDLHNIRETNPHWTHVALVLQATSKPIQFRVDIYNPDERYLYLKAPRWFATKKKSLVKETSQGSVYYKIFIEDLTESFQGIEIIIEPFACLDNFSLITVKICTPWAPGFKTYRVFAGNAESASAYVNVPMNSPTGYNTSVNPVEMELFLDSGCRYSISYKFSLADTMSRIVEQFYHWLPAHLITALLMVLKNQILQFHLEGDAKCLRPHNGFFQYSSLFITTACRIFKKILMRSEFLPQTDIPNYSILVAIIVQSVAIIASILFCFGVWALISFYGNVISKLLLRLVRISSATHSVLEKVIKNFPLSFGVLAIAVAIRTCGGLALIIACLVYLLLLSDAYKDYLENWMWRMAIRLYKQMRAKIAKARAVAVSIGATPENDINIDEYVVNLTTNELVQYEGMQNFCYHIALFTLLFIMTALNAVTTISWVKNYKIGNPLPDPSLLPSIIVLGTLSLLWQLEAPIKCSSYRYGYCIVSVLLYVCASVCILYCQEAVYRLNYLIAFVFVLMLVQELLCRLWRKFAAIA